MIQSELKDLRDRFGFTLKQCADALECSVEAYRRKELGSIPISGIELSRLADLYQMPLRAAFPSYRPSAAEVSFARHVAKAA